MGDNDETRKLEEFQEEMHELMKKHGVCLVGTLRFLGGKKYIAYYGGDRHPGDALQDMHLIVEELTERWIKIDNEIIENQGKLTGLLRDSGVSWDGNN